MRLITKNTRAQGIASDEKKQCGTVINIGLAIIMAGNNVLYAYVILHQCSD